MIVGAATCKRIIARAAVDDHAAGTGPGQGVGRGIACQAGNLVAVRVKALGINVNLPVHHRGLPGNHIAAIGQCSNLGERLIPGGDGVDTDFGTNLDAAGIEELGEDAIYITGTLACPGH